MDYTGLLTKAWNTVWNNKFLIVLGLLAAFGQGARNRGSNNFNYNNGGLNNTPGNFPPDIERLFARGLNDLTPGLMAVIAVVLCFAVVIYIAVMILNRTAQGGLINGVNTIDGGGPSSFSIAFRAGWNKIGTLVLIWLVAAIPSILIILVLSVMGFSYFSSGQGELLRDALRGENFERVMRAVFTNTGFLLGILAVLCPLAIISLIMQAIAQFADRACVIEGKGLVDSFQRGFEVLRDHLGNAVAVYILQIVINGAVWLVVAIPGLCCLLWPFLWVVAGMSEAYFSTVWTLAWRQWTGSLPSTGEPTSPAPSPSV